MDQPVTIWELVGKGGAGKAGEVSCRLLRTADFLYAGRLFREVTGSGQWDSEHRGCHAFLGVGQLSSSRVQRVRQSQVWLVVKCLESWPWKSREDALTSVANSG